MKKIIYLLSVLLVISLITVGCAANKSMDKSDSLVDEKYNYGDQSGDGFAPPAENTDRETDSSRVKINNKIIKTGYIEIETLDFDKSVDAVKKSTEKIGGYVESSNIEGTPKYRGYTTTRDAHFIIRVPNDKFEQFIDDAGNLGNVIRTQNKGIDVSEEYYDTEARLESLKLQEERLLAILEKADKLSDILDIEKELSNVRYEIEQHTGKLKKLDSLVNFSTIEITLYEVEKLQEEDPETLGEKISRGFLNSLEGSIKILESLLIFILGSIPYFILLGIFTFVVYKLVMWIIRRKEK